MRAGAMCASSCRGHQRARGRGSWGCGAIWLTCSAGGGEWRRWRERVRVRSGGGVDRGSAITTEICTVRGRLRQQNHNMQRRESHNSSTCIPVSKMTSRLVSALGGGRRRRTHPISLDLCCFRCTCRLVATLIPISRLSVVHQRCLEDVARPTTSAATARISSDNCWHRPHPRSVINLTLRALFGHQRHRS